MVGLSFVNSASKSAVRKAVRVLACRLQLHQVHDVDHADLEFRQVPANQFHRRQRLQGGTSPQHAMTTSGSSPLSLLAHSQIPRPIVQCFTA